MKTCTKCKELKELNQFGKDLTRKDGLNCYCKACIRIHSKTYYKANPEKNKAKNKAWDKANPGKRRAYGKAYSNTLIGRYTAYRCSAKTRGIPFSFTKDEFATFWQLPCSYCGDPILTIGIDRVDSSLGYVEGNCVPCCTVCNIMKLDYNEEQWLTQMFKVLTHKGVV